MWRSCVWHWCWSDIKTHNLPHIAPRLLKVCREETRIGLRSASGRGVKEFFTEAAAQELGLEEKIHQEAKSSRSKFQTGESMCKISKAQMGMTYVGWQQQSSVTGDSEVQEKMQEGVEKTRLKHRWGKATKPGLINTMLLIMSNHLLF